MDGVRKVNEWITMPGRTLIVNDINAVMENIPDGTLYINPITGRFKLKVGGTNSWTDTNLSHFSTAGTVTDDIFIPGAIHSSKIAAGEIKNINIGASEVTNDKLKDKVLGYTGITSIKIADNAIKREHLEDASVGEFEIENLAIKSKHIDAQAVTKGKIGLDAVQTINIENLAVTEGKLAANAVSNDKIKIKVPGTYIGIDYDKIADNAIRTEHIKDANVTGAKIAVNTITNTNIMVGEIKIDKLFATVQSDITNAVKADATTKDVAIIGNLTVAKDITVTKGITAATLKITTSGASTFVGNSSEKTIAHGAGKIPTAVYVTPTTNPNGYLGEVWARFDATNIYVGNSGSHTGSFCWVALF